MSWYDDFDSWEHGLDEDESNHGTSQCDGTCDPQCDWCLVAHDCPDAHGDDPCPYEALIAEKTAQREEFLVVRPDGSGVYVTLAEDTSDDIDF